MPTIKDLVDRMPLDEDGVPILEASARAEHPANAALTLVLKELFPLLTKLETSLPARDSFDHVANAARREMQADFKKLRAAAVELKHTLSDAVAYDDPNDRMEATAFDGRPSSPAARATDGLLAIYKQCAALGAAFKKHGAKELERLTKKPGDSFRGDEAFLTQLSQLIRDHAQYFES